MPTFTRTATRSKSDGGSGSGSSSISISISSVSSSQHGEVSLTPTLEVPATTPTTSTPRYRTRSHTRSLSDSCLQTPSPTAVPAAPASALKFPFFDHDEHNPTNITGVGGSRAAPRNYDRLFSNYSTRNEDYGGGGGGGVLSPLASATPAVDWDSELSPIAKNRDSDASEHEVLDIHIPADSVIETVVVNGQDAHDPNPTEGQISSGYPSSPLAADPQEGTEASDDVGQDLSSARKQVGQSSNEFIERIRNAAHQRKVAMTRSRDALVAKEEEQLRSIADAKVKEEEVATARAARDAANQASAKNRRALGTAHLPVQKPFKARPLPATTGMQGSGGLEGVPKVETKPTTTPFSPLLGPKRRQKIKIKALEAPKHTMPKPVHREVRKPALKPQQPATYTADPDVKPFKARPMPAAVGSKGHGGLCGVPKIPKKPTTTPFSPTLGPKRREKVKIKALEPPKQLPSNAKVHPRDVPSKQKPLANDMVRPFQARPVPDAVGAKGHGGQFGVPKVNKRPTTVAQSPLLGPRRRSRSLDPTEISRSPSRQMAHPKGSNRDSAVSTRSSMCLLRYSSSTTKSSQMTAQSPVLLGLQLLDVATPCHIEINDENVLPTSNPSSVTAYQPHSTIRAKKRADYDARRDTLLELKTEREQRLREERIRKMHRELNSLRSDL